MSARETLAEMRAIEQAATEGPWRRVTEPGTKNHALHDARDADIATDYEGVWYDKGDAEFIADARSFVPKAIAALDAVLALNTGDNRHLYGNDFEAGMAKALWLAHSAIEQALS